VAEEIARGIGDVSDCRILLPRADIARKALAQLFRGKGAQVDEVTVYRTRPAETDPAQISRLKAWLEAGKINVVTFTSSSTVRQLLEWIEDASLLEEVTVACIGPITAATARELGLSVEIVAQEHTIDGLLQALLKGMSSHV
jgi:uroporphyrinogen III methyltransferase/synthase